MVEHLEVEWGPSGNYLGKGYRKPLPKSEVCRQVHSVLRTDTSHLKSCGSFECVWCREVSPWCAGSDGPGIRAHLCRSCAIELDEYAAQELEWDKRIAEARRRPD